MSISTESIKRLISEKGITKQGLEALRKQGLSWREAGYSYSTRKTYLLDIARYLGVDTAKKVTKLRPTLRPKPEIPPVKIPLRRRIIEKIAKTRFVKKFFKILKGKKPDRRKGWYVLYEREVCDKSPPCDPEDPNTRWEMRSQHLDVITEKPEPRLEVVRNEIFAWGGGQFLGRTRNWSLVYCSSEGKTKESKQTRR